MSHPIRRTGITLPLTRSVAIAALMSAPLAAAPLISAHAQTSADAGAPPTPPRKRARASSSESPSCTPS